MKKQKTMLIGDIEVPTRYYNRCKSIYETLSSEYSLGNMKKEEQVHKLVIEAEKIQTEICENSDKIKIDMAEEALAKFNVEKANFIDFVAFTAKIIQGKNIDNDKVMNKMYKSVSKLAKTINTKKSFYEGYLDTGDTDTLPEDANIDDTLEISTKTNKELSELLEKAAHIRIFIDQSLKPRYNTLACGAEYISDFVLKRQNFKDMVDWEHYKGGGYPNDTSLPKLLSIVESFSYAHTLLTTYGFETNLNKCLTREGLMESSISCSKTLKDLLETIKNTHDGEFY